MKKKDLSVRSQNLLKEIRESRLRSYQSTPGDIEEHYKAELRVAGDTAGRPLIELIQNADDAMQEAKGDLKNQRVRIILEEDRFIVANDGAPFNEEGVEAICNLDRSPKKDRRITIGNKGIGFKSVLTWTKIPSIYSNPYKFTFDRQKSAKEISESLDRKYDPNDVPLMRLPFEAGDPDDRVKIIFDKGFTTAVILSLRNKKVFEEIMGELKEFDPLTLLFLNAVSELEILTQTFERKFSVIRQEREILIKADGETRKYMVFRDEKKVPPKISSLLPEDHRNLTHSAISIALSEKPLELNPMIFSYFPTGEPSPFPFFIHGDFILDAGRKHLRGDAIDYNQWVCQQLAILFAKKVKRFLFKTQGPILIDFLNCRSCQEMQEAERLTFNSFAQIIGKNAFLPVLGNSLKTVSPQEAILFAPEVIEDLCQIFHREIQWEGHYLIEPEWCIQKRVKILKKFGAKELKISEAIKIIAKAAQPNPGWCTKVLNIILKWIEKALDWRYEEQESKDDLANVLKYQPIFYSNRGKLRPLITEESYPLFLPPSGDKSLDVPQFITLDLLHPEVGKILGKEEKDKFEKRFQLLSQYGLYPFRPKEIIEKGVIPAISDAGNLSLLSNEDKGTLLLFLAQLESSEQKFDEIEPYPWFDKVRTQLARNVFVPTCDGNWYPAWRVYAGSNWGAIEKLTKIYKNIPERSFLTPPDDPIHQEVPIEKWKSLYRYLGVSWEPKILPFEKHPDNISQYHFPNIHPSCISDEDWQEYAYYTRNESDLSDMWRWTIHLKESYALDGWLFIKNDPDKSKNFFDLLYETDIFSYLFGSEKEKIKTQFEYTKISYSYSAKCESLVQWSIKNLSWLTSTNGVRYSPKELFLSNSETGRALKGIVPIIDLSNPHGKVSLRKWEDLLDEIGIRRNWDQVSIEDWRQWLQEITQKCKDLDRDSIEIVRTLYKFCLEKCVTNGNILSFGDIEIFCLGKGGVEIRFPTEVIYFDEARFDAIKEKLLDIELLFFPVELGEERAERAKNLFGVSLVSERIVENIASGDVDEGKTDYWNKKFGEVKPVLLARLAKDRPQKRTEDEDFFKSLQLKAVNSLERQFCLQDTKKSLYHEEATACWTDNGGNYLFLNSKKPEKSVWLGIAEALARRLGQTFYEAFEVLLLCESNEEMIDKLRKSGVPQEDILYCKQALEETLRSLPGKEKGIEEQRGLESIRSPKRDREKEGIEWRQQCRPEDAEVKIQGYETIKAQTSSERERGVVISHESEKREAEKELDALTSEDKKNIGRWGEQYALRCLKEILKGKYPESTVDETDDGFNICIDGESIVEVYWLNKAADRREGYDIKLTESGNEAFIEVKSTKMEDKDWFEVSKPQWEFAQQKRDTFHIYRIYGSGTKNPRLVDISDPYLRWQEGGLIAYPIRIRI